jgi:hypothetical protein
LADSSPEHDLIRSGILKEETKKEEEGKKKKKKTGLDLRVSKLSQ